MVKPIIACATGIGLSDNQIEAIASQLEADFLCSDSESQVIRACNLRRLSCVFVDFEKSSTTAAAGRLIPQNRLVFYAVPKGDVKAAFRAARLGGMNVLEKPIALDEAMLNIAAAFKSEQRLQELATTEVEFSHLLFPELSEREQHVLALAISGEPNKRVAGILDIGLRTVENDRANLLKKLKVNTFANLIQLAVQRQHEANGVRRRLFQEELSG